MSNTEANRRNFIKSVAVGSVGIAGATVLSDVEAAVPAGREGESEAFRRTFGELWSRIAAYTVEIASAMPEEHYDFKPVPEVRTFKEEMLHIAGSDFWINNYFGEGKGTGDDYGAGGKSKADCIGLMESSFENMSALIRDISDDELHTTVETFAGEMTRMDVLWFMRDHITHHRAKAVVALRLNGVTPPSYIGS